MAGNEEYLNLIFWTCLLSYGVTFHPNPTVKDPP